MKQNLKPYELDQYNNPDYIPTEWDEDYSEAAASDVENIAPLTPITEAKPRPFIVEDIVPAGYLSALFGPGDTGKSHLALQLAVSVAAGIPFLGKQTIQGDVLYVDYELDKDEQDRRLKQVVNGLDLEWEAVKGRIEYLQPITTIEKLAPYLAQKIRESENAVFTIVDSIRYATALNLQDDQHAAILIRELRRLGTVLFIGHQAKPQQNNRGQYAPTLFGSVFLTNAARSVWRADKKNEIVTLKHEKHNFTSERCPDIKVKIAGDDQRIKFVLDEGRPQKKEDKLDKTFQALGNLGKATAKEISNNLKGKGIKRAAGTVQNDLTELNRQKKVIVAGEAENGANVYAPKSRHFSKAKTVTK